MRLTKIESSKSDPSAIFPNGVLTTAPCLYRANNSIRTPVLRPKIAILLDKECNVFKFSTLYFLPVLASDNFNKTFL